jgi:hypothetical protein
MLHLVIFEMKLIPIVGVLQTAYIMAFMAETKHFSLLQNIQTSSGPHPAFYIRAPVFFPGINPLVPEFSFKF